MATAGVADTRLLLTLEVPPDEATRRSILGPVERELGRRLIAPSIVSTEYIKLAGARIGAEGAVARLSTLKDRGMRVLPVGEEEAVTAGKLLLAHHGAPMADALIAAFVVNREAEYVVTDDPRYRDLGVRSKWV